VTLSPQAEDFLVNHDWPGNVRELSNVLERAVHYAERDRVELADLPRYLFKETRPAAQDRPKSLRTVQHTAERNAICRALETAGYNKARAAQLLGIHRSLFYKKIKKYGIPLQAR
jgi:transcriptional regulator with PAS, ATPase and Fis domain